MSSDCKVVSGKYVLDGTIVDVDQDYVYMYGLENEPLMRIDSVVKREYGWFIGGSLKAGRKAGKLEYLPKEKRV
ncbi:hypothetical protein H6785_03050 [Candidatus Nomurabacteria bacterium]|nr:hypothetical protein [Candidatus Nomurabacteria bacterium]